ncbi:MAG: IS1595 family transposase [Pseudoxanthomonas mexicana]|nr:IS1595 family transposase [Pseudoxanthomonas mexicana]
MAMNRVQFQSGLSMFEFLERYGTEQQCEQAVFAMRWPGGFVCPRCNGGDSFGFRRGRQPYRECRGCGYQCSLIVGTLLEATKLPLTRWFMALQLITQAKNGIAALELMRQLKVSYPTAWLVKHKVMEAMRLHEADRQLSGRVEIDDAYLGGERSGGKSGRGSENKIPFVVAVQTNAGGQIDQVCMAQLPFRRSAIEDFMRTHTARPLTTVSDGLDCFAVARRAGVHERVVTGGGREAARDPRFAAVNTVLGNLKTAFAGTYYAFDFAKYAARYLADVQFRINHRYRLDLMLVAIARSLLCAPPLTRPQIRAPEVGC